MAQNYKLTESKIIKLLFIAVAIILGIYFTFSGLIKAQGFFAPLLTAIILSLIILPLCRWFESFMGRTASSLLGTFILMLISFGLFLLILYQIKNFTNQWPDIKETMQPKIEELSSYLSNNTPLDDNDLNQFAINESKAAGMGLSLQNLGGKLSAVMMQMVSFLGIYFLTFIYIYFLLRYRLMFKNFMLRISPDNEKDKTTTIIYKSAKVATQYLQGKLILIGILAVVYSVGLGLSGVSNFILVGLIAALFTIIPYIGNIIGFGMAMIFGYLTTGTTTILIGITATFVISQLLENYVLQPFVIGDKVDVHPFFIIVVVIMGNFVWGVIGMILAIPILGILTVILLHIDKLKPLGLLFSKRKFNGHDD
ncbi:Predicted PurR-regulated permease PerM [Flavobacteriaceae bacterium MAR_2010_188]|nr:Predicted PurR-regulated permease PerM [Flavobacteriaceae bacterium MAR_2010_188]